MSYNLFMAIFMGVATVSCIFMMFVSRKEGERLGFSGYFVATMFALAHMLGYVQKVENPPNSQGSSTSVTVTSIATNTER